MSSAMKSLLCCNKPKQIPLTKTETMSSNGTETQDDPPISARPILGNWDSAHTTIGAGVAIFHIASSRVVLCYHSTKKFWFLPKGRRDASEDTGSGAEREGFEEVGILTITSSRTPIDGTSSQATAIAFYPYQCQRSSQSHIIRPLTLFLPRS